MNFEKQSTVEQKGVRNDACPAISVNPSYRVSCKIFGGCVQIAKQMERTQRQILDSVLGVIVWKELTEVDFFSDYIWDGLSVMITNLEELIHWLTTYPAGLKLNSHLNAILSQFFVYHIYLWQSKLKLILMKSRRTAESWNLSVFYLLATTYIQRKEEKILDSRKILNILPYLSVASVYIGFGFISLSCFFGLSVFFAALSDLLRLLTVHIYCFHIYAFKLATLSVMSIKSLWRLFRGRKYNPLRQRVDSVKLDMRQLFIATLFFIILLFLLPTILVYFFVFSSAAICVFTFMFIAVPLPTISIDRVVSILIGEKALLSRSLAILDIRPEEQFVKGHIIGAEHYPRILLSRENYETESMKRVGTQGTLVVCGQIYGASQVVSTLCDRGYNAVLLRGGIASETLCLKNSEYSAGFLKATTSSINRSNVRKEMRQRNQMNKHRAWK
ncbi:N-acetylglucosaminyl transferase component [Onchocerca flexuosa]|uniref:N-acetylglucosaminyl transferase component n=1 Tax=Onchocerca flexuosa TaxID=387005 RepID=A0A238BIN3_9BILA|nr:N-acetylglucosaminyl transferase component [Onchocerca flexuosa]